MEKYHHDGSHEVLNKDESIAYALRIFKLRARKRISRNESYAKNADKINKKQREEYANNPEPALQRKSEYYHKNRDVINEKARAKRRKDRAAASSDTAKMMRQLSEEYEARVGEGGDIEASDLNFVHIL